MARRRRTPIDNPLTVLGQGDVAWAAYYDNVVNRLAFYDDLSGIRSGPLAYLVCGWYSNPAQDPLGDTRCEIADRLQQQDGAVAVAACAGELNEAVNHSRKYILGASKLGLTMVQAESVAGQRCGCVEREHRQAMSPPMRHPAFLRSIRAGKRLGRTRPTAHGGRTRRCFTARSLRSAGRNWAGPATKAACFRASKAVRRQRRAIAVAVGNTIPEALAALVAQKNQSPDEARILEAFLLGVLPQLNEANGRATVDAALHANSFASLDGGFTTEQLWIPQMPDTPPPLPKPVTPNPGVFPHQAKVGVPGAGISERGVHRNLRAAAGQGQGADFCREARLFWRATSLPAA